MAATAPGSTGLMRLVTFGRSLLSVFRAESAGRARDWPLLPPSTPADASDIKLGLGLAAVIFALRLFSDNVLCAALLRKRSPKDRAKLSEALFYTAYYTAAFAFFAFAVVPNAPFLRSWPLFSNAPGIDAIFSSHPPPRSPHVALYYMQALGFYISALVFLVLFDTRRKDFAHMVVHHTVTLALVVASYHFSYTRAGALVIALHDFGDIFLYLATALNKVGVRGADTAVFAAFVVAFYVTRLLILPRLVHSLVVETLQTVIARPHFLGWGMYFEAALAHWSAFAAMFFTLITLHSYWFALALRMIYREVVQGKKISDEGDIREEDSD